MLRDHDHGRTRDFLGRLERGDLKALQPPTPDLYGAANIAAAGPWGITGTILGGQQAGATRDYAAQAGAVWKNSAVAIGLSWFADNLPEPRPRVARRKADGSTDYRTDLPAVRTMRRPNRFYRWATLITACNLSYRVDGNAFILIARNPFFRKGDPVELYWVDHRHIRPRADASGPYWERWTGKGWKRHELDEVIHLRDGIDPDNPRLGCSALKRCLREVCTDNEAATYHEAILRNMGVVGVVIQPADEDDGFGSPEEREAIADTFVDKTTGNRRGRPLVSSIRWKLDQLGVKPDEMALDQILKIPESRICGALRLPAMVLGLAVGAEQRTFSNYGEARKAAYEDAVIPFLKLVAEAFTDDLLPLLEGQDGDEVDFDYSAVQCLGESEDAKFARYGDAYQTNKGITRNEYRSGIGLETVETGDTFADGTSPEPAEAEAPAGAVAAGDGTVQDTALNGAQITSLAGLIAQVTAGQLPAESARAIIAASFPALTAEQVEQIVGPLATFVPKPAEPAPVARPAADGPAPGPADAASDEAIKALMPRLAALLDQLGVAQ